MKLSIEGMIEAGEPLMQQAIDAMRRYHQAQDEARPAAEVEKLRQEAEFLFQAVNDYAQRALGGSSVTLQ